MGWFQQEIQLPAFPQGIHKITDRLVAALPDLDRVRVGLLNVFVRHTSAGLTINENADPDVLYDLNQSLAALAPDDAPYRHVEEGPDDMPAHVKASLMGCSLTIPIRNGLLCLGVWQGICLCEHRRDGGRRRLVLTLQGDFDEES
ncbi:MAG: secondary thiamine-phosphate synthase enzyme YjbQ [Thermoguttaceae bacterium]